MSKYTLDFTEEDSGKRKNRSVSKKWYQFKVPIWVALLIGAKAIFFLFGFWHQHNERKQLTQLHRRVVVKYDSLATAHAEINTAQKRALLPVNGKNPKPNNNSN
jgi:hypothetical protein